MIQINLFVLLLFFVSLFAATRFKFDGLIEAIEVCLRYINWVTCMTRTVSEGWRCTFWKKCRRAETWHYLQPCSAESYFNFLTIDNCNVARRKKATAPLISPTSRIVSRKRLSIWRNKTTFLTRIANWMYRAIQPIPRSRKPYSSGEIECSKRCCNISGVFTIGRIRWCPTPFKIYILFLAILRSHGPYIFQLFDVLNWQRREFGRNRLARLLIYYLVLELWRRKSYEVRISFLLCLV